MKTRKKTTHLTISNQQLLHIYVHYPTLKTEEKKKKKTNKRNTTENLKLIAKTYFFAKKKTSK